MSKHSVAAMVIGSALWGLFGPVRAAAPRFGPASPAILQTRITLSEPRALAQTELDLSCFEGSVSVLLNPGCFETTNPSQPGDCVSTSAHYLVQYIFPDVAVTHRVRGFGFLSNDGATVFPSAGVFQFPIVQGEVRYPTTTELANLQVDQISSGTDTTVAFVDVESHDIRVQPGGNTALIVALQFPSGGDLTSVGVGPGIAADADHPDQACDVFTIDGGSSWFEPIPCSVGDPNCEPLDWGFVIVLDPVVSVTPATWAQVKVLFRTP